MYDVLLGAGGTIVGISGVIYGEVTKRKNQFYAEMLEYRLTKAIEEKERLKQKNEIFRAAETRYLSDLDKNGNMIASLSTMKNDLTKRVDYLLGVIGVRDAALNHYFTVAKTLANNKEFRIRRCHNGMLGASLSPEEILDLFK